jgi:hypothetical protein
LVEGWWRKRESRFGRRMVEKEMMVEREEVW